MESGEWLIEEIDSNDIPEAELSEFQETHPLRVVGIIDCEAGGSSGVLKPNVPNATEEGALINRYIQGEGDFPELYTKLEPGEEEDDDDDVISENLTVEPMVIDDDDDDDDTGDDDEDDDESNENRVAFHNLLNIDSRPSTSQEQERRQKQLARTMKATSTKQSRKAAGLGRRSVLSPALLGLMGEANLSLAHGRIETAERICLEIIRQNPLASEPFYTLAGIYETQDTDKFLNILTIAVHLNSHDRDTWIRIADLHIAQGNFGMARIFYTKAIKALYKDYDLRLRKGQLLERMGETYAAMCSYLKMLPIMPKSQTELCLETAKRVATYFHALKKIVLAIEAMQSAYKVCGKLFPLEHISLYLELLILNKQFDRAVSLLHECTSLEIETEREDGRELILFCSIPDDYVPEVRTMLCVSLIHLNAHHLLGYIVQNVHKHIPLTSESIHQYMDVTEALMEEHKYAEAIALMQPITDGDVVECPALVWQRQAECLSQLNRPNEAIETYERVVELAPFCYDAKFQLSTLLKQQGRHVEAVKALEQSGEREGQPLHARLLFERCLMLQQLERIDEFLEIGCVLLGRHSVKLKSRQEMLAAANGGNFYNADSIRAILRLRDLTEQDSERTLQEFQKPPTETSDVSIEDEYYLFKQLVNAAFKHEKFSAMERLCFAIVTTKRFQNFQVDIERTMILSCYFNEDSAIAFSYLREIISKNPGRVNLWNLLSLIVQKGDTLRYYRYLRRLVGRHQVARGMRLFLGHYHLNCSSYKYALNNYVPLFREQRQPLVALCIAVVFNQLALQKKVLRKAAAVGQAIAFAHKYSELRAGSEKEHSPAHQEIYYNIARFYHQAGILHLAVEYYERALAIKHPLIEEHETYLCLRHEIAFNLHLIYRANGNDWKARQYLYRYCIV